MPEKMIDEKKRKDLWLGSISIRKVNGGSNEQKRIGLLINGQKQIIACSSVSDEEISRRTR